MMNEEEFWLSVEADIQESVLELKKMYPELTHEEIKDSFTDLFFHLREEYGVR